jgi:hypothetical protein
MKIRTLVIAIVILAALSGIVAVVNRPAPAPAADAREGQPLAARATVEQAVGFRITDVGKTVELKKSAAGAWLVTSYFDFPADVEKLSRFASDLTEAKVGRFVTASPERLSRLGFADTRVQLLNAAGQPLLDLVLGKTPDTGGGRFLRFGAEDKAYLARFDSFLDTEPKNWADSSLLQLKPDDIAKFELTFPVANEFVGVHTPGSEVTVAAVRAKTGDAFVAVSAPAGQQLKATAIATILGNLSTLRFTDTVVSSDPNAALAMTDSRTVKLTTFDNKTITLALGRKPEEKKPKAAAPKTADASAGAAATPSSPDKPADAASAKPAEPEFDVIPAGPVFVTITHSDAAAPVNALMAQRAFQIADYLFTALPQTPADLFEPSPAPAASGTPPSPSVVPGAPDKASAAPAK